MKLTRREVLRLAAEAQCDPRTVVHIYDGKESKQIVRERVVAAAKKFKIQVPKKETT